MSSKSVASSRCARRPLHCTNLSLVHAWFAAPLVDFSRLFRDRPTGWCCTPPHPTARWRGSFCECSRAPKLLACRCTFLSLVVACLSVVRVEQVEEFLTVEFNSFGHFQVGQPHTEGIDVCVLRFAQSTEPSGPRICPRLLVRKSERCFLHQINSL